MKNYIVLLIIILLLSCEGKFEPINSLGEVELSFPLKDEECEEGRLVDEQTIEIPFRWNATLNATSYTLEVRDTRQNSIALEQSGINSTSFSGNLLPGTPYQWKVIATDGINTKTSPVWNFYSSGLSTENHVPFPAEITISEFNDGSIQANWTAEDLDDDIRAFNIFFGSSPNPAILEENYSSESITLEVEIGIDYYLIIRTIDELGNYSDSSLTFKF